MDDLIGRFRSRRRSRDYDACCCIFYSRTTCRISSRNLYRLVCYVDYRCIEQLGVISMAKHKKKKKPEIRIYFKDGKTDIIPQKFWDDYEVNHGLFVVKKNEAWIAFYNLNIIDCVVVH